jgi:Asp-tRNA(Asn)/Glu-tRNA(Gln) amidotransferase A subunit family amidase
VTIDAAHLGAQDAAEAICSGKVSSLELVEACLGRIEQFDEDIGAWIHLDAELALEQARRADESRRRGQTTGPLHGVPVGIKDIVDTFDLPTECGTVLCAGRTPSRDASLVARLREAGAVILGKTVTTELAVYTPGKTRNPHNADRTPGGSSSGSAAAVAAFMTPLSVGTQTNGSVIRPASFCGVFGFKPSFGRISRRGVLGQSRPLDTVGMFARNLGDLALISDVLMVYEQQDPDMQPRARPGISRMLAQSPPVDPRLAFVRTPAWSRADQTTKDAFRELVEHFDDRVDIVDLPSSFDRAHEDHKLIMEADLARSFGRFYRSGGEKMSEKLRGMIEQGQRVLATDYNDALGRIEEYNDLLAEFFVDYDAFLTPSTPGEAPDLATTGDPVFCTIWTLCGTPALNLPVFQGPSGMPLGAQLVGAKGDDARLFRTARWLTERLEQ